MKNRQKQELRTKTISELIKEIGEKEKEILKLGMEVRLAKVKNTSALSRQKDELAVMKTILKEKQLAETEVVQAKEGEEK